MLDKPFVWSPVENDIPDWLHRAEPMPSPDEIMGIVKVLHNNIINLCLPSTSKGIIEITPWFQLKL